MRRPNTTPLFGLLLMALGLCACGGSRAPSDPALTRSTATTATTSTTPSGVVIHELVPGVWLHTSTRHIEPWGEVPATGMLVEREATTVLVDTAWTDPQTSEIVTWAREVLGKPIEAAVFTHAHSDKMGGVAALRELDIATYAAADSNAFALERDLVPAERGLSFDGGESLELPPLVVFDPGAGHTLDNIVVALPEAGVVFGGCLIRPPRATNLGNTADADIDHWDDAVLAVAERFPSAQYVVPSHGPPAGRELFDATIELVQSAAP